MLKKLKRSGITVSSPILWLLILILGITLFNGFLLTQSLKTTIYKDAYLVNKTGEIRGLLQRYSKLKIARLDTVLTEKQLQNNFAIINEIIKGNYLPKEKKLHFLSLLNSVKSIWSEISKTSSQQKLIQLSETAWRKSENLTNYIQHISEYKKKLLINKITFITLISSLLILIIILYVYFMIKKGLEKEKIIDPLTKLYNRRHFIEIFNYYIDVYERYQRLFSIIFLDIDNFKKINDTYGHQKGDDVLMEISKLIMQKIRNTDMAFRYGGEEIVIILPETDLENTYLLAERIRKSICAKINVNSKPVTVSMGIGTYKGEGLFSFLKRVDNAVYEAKKTGKNKVIIS